MLEDSDDGKTRGASLSSEAKKPLTNRQSPLSCLRAFKQERCYSSVLLRPLKQIRLVCFARAILPIASNIQIRMIRGLSARLLQPKYRPTSECTPTIE